MKKAFRPIIGCLTVFVALCAAVNVSVPAAAAGGPAVDRQGLFSAAAAEFHVPEQLLLAVSYNESRWVSHGDEPSNDNGFGLMNLRGRVVPAESTDNGRGDDASHAGPGTAVAASSYTLDDAAEVLGVPSGQLKADDRQNIRAGAAVLAQYARRLGNGRLPTDLGGWYGAVAAYSGSQTTQQAARFADGVYTTMQAGATLTTADGEAVTLAAQPSVRPDRAAMDSLGLTATTAISEPADCPATITCTFVPAAYQQNSSNPTDYGNYDLADRPTHLPVRYIVIHDTEGSYAGTVNWFQNPSAYSSANYVIRSSDGAVTEMVRPDDVAWSAGNWYANMHSINIEHEGYATEGATWYTEAMYQASANLVRYLAAQYQIPLDREHIIGHDQVPGPNSSSVAGMHWDPGPYWDWNHYMNLILGTPVTGSGVQAATHVATILPAFSTNRPTITKCSQNNKRCVLPAQGASVVYLHTRPSSTAPLLTDPYLHSNGKAGTNMISDWSATAPSGRQYVVAGRSGDWTAVWFGSQKGWFYDPADTGQAAVAASGTVVIPRSGLASATVYGSAYPESTAYASGVPVQPLSPLYSIPAGQSYVLTDQSTPTDYYYAPVINSVSTDQTVVIGSQRYYQISYNHRIGYVKADEVTATIY